MLVTFHGNPNHTKERSESNSLSLEVWSLGHRFFFFFFFITLDRVTNAEWPDPGRNIEVLDGLVSRVKERPE